MLKTDGTAIGVIELKLNGHADMTGVSARAEKSYFCKNTDCM